MFKASIAAMPGLVIRFMALSLRGSGGMYKIAGFSELFCDRVAEQRALAGSLEPVADHIRRGRIKRGGRTTQQSRERYALAPGVTARRATACLSSSAPCRRVPAAES